jgi:DNA-binding response OmpR family regulator
MVTSRTRAAVTALLLIVEPDVLVRTAVADYLRECGYTVFEANNSKEAVVLLHSAPEIRVVMVDVGTPDVLDGFTLVQWIRQEKPDIKVVMTAGIVRTAKTAGALCQSGPLLRKPYHHHELERRIRQLLADR